MTTPPKPDRTFTFKGSQPVEHRKTGPGTASQHPSEMDDIEPTTKDDCRDLLREWRVGT